jgi:hypothetical protein
MNRTKFPEKTEVFPAGGLGQVPTLGPLAQSAVKLPEGPKGQKGQDG